MTIATSASSSGTIDDLRALRPHLAASLERLDVDQAGPHRHTLARLLQVLETFPATSGHALRATVLANMFGLIARGEAADYQETALLVRSTGQGIAEIQDEFDALVGIAPGRPFTTATILMLADSTHIKQLLADAGHLPTEADRIATDCSRTALWLLTAGIDAIDPAPMPASPEDLRILVKTRGVGVWRAVLANIAANPFGPDPATLADLAHDAGLPDAVLAVEGCTRLFRRRFEEAERLEVAHEIRDLVAASGYSQRQFARFIGTSGPRLSTYVNGLVTPSASMMVRIRRCAAALAHEHHRAAG